ncbi:tyrosine-type recombinase/integrase [Streptococcus entericus]|uniref:tyrosine-type recombinase/integrase n=1 Tax=Streptococcus entericus TaxID=155680 RepID=UPI000362ED5C|nr:site-specific integrase [Streptococcus entericus]
MYYRTRQTKKGTIRYEIGDKYRDPLTGKWKNVTVSYTKNTSRARKQAERELQDKIAEAISVTENRYLPETIQTFGQLKQNWLESWSVSVKPQTVKREELVIKRLGQIIGDGYLLCKITPLLMKNSLSTYMSKYDASPSTMTHIKSTCNKIFNHGVLYNIIAYSPMTAIKLDIPLEKKREASRRREAKFLEIHELHAFFDTLRRRRNPSYYDLAIVLLFSGIRIGEAAFTVEDFNMETGVLTIDKSLQYNNLRVEDYYFDSTKTINSERQVVLPQVACEAILRTIERGKEFDSYAEANPCPSFRTSPSIFRTEYGSPITSHSFREVLARVEKELLATCEERYGFKWKKHVTPHSFRHMHITYLQSGDSGIAIREVMERVGHAHFETTMGYTHKLPSDQEQALATLNKFAQDNGFEFRPSIKWSCKYSPLLQEVIEEHISEGKIELAVDEFRKAIGLAPSYTVRHIASNILPKVRKDLSNIYHSFDIICIKNNQNQLQSYRLVWE